MGVAYDNEEADLLTEEEHEMLELLKLYNERVDLDDMIIGDYYLYKKPQEGSINKCFLFKGRLKDKDKSKAFFDDVICIDPDFYTETSYIDKKSPLPIIASKNFYTFYKRQTGGRHKPTGSRHKSKRSNKRGRNYFKQFKKTTMKTLPKVKSGLKMVGTTVKEDALPVVETGLSAIYSGLATGVNLGVKGVKQGVQVVKKVSASRRKQHHKKTKRRR